MEPGNKVRARDANQLYVVPCTYLSARPRDLYRYDYETCFTLVFSVCQKAHVIIPHALQQSCNSGFVTDFQSPLSLTATTV